MAKILVACFDVCFGFIILFWLYCVMVWVAYNTGVVFGMW